ncbi:amino acid adenylation domain-containing protein, partial [Phaeospirillum tilakii]
MTTRGTLGRAEDGATAGRSAPPDPAAGCFAQAFAATCDRAPAAIAISTAQGDLSFAALDRAANRLAHGLRAAGLVPGEAVGVVVGRSAALPEAFLAILKAGGIYLPLGADLPAERLATMARVAGMRFALRLDPPPPGLAEAAPGLALLDPAECAAGQPDRRPAPCRRPDDPATILFTSGSTGQPKGVPLRHESLVAMVRGHVEAQRIIPDDRILLASAPGFILGFRELCLPLLVGAACVPVGRALLDDPAALAAEMTRRRVSVALFTPSYLRLFQRRAPAGLRLLMTAGERPDPAEARAFARQLECWNMHGATEVCGTICLTRVDPDGDGPIPSGRPFPGTGVHLLDEDGGEAAPGAVGEIHVTGPGVAGRYLGQPELSAAQFVPTRWGLAYRTRDLGRWRPDGQLETLGRIDDVVKLSGQRVALGEIEQTLARHPGIRRAAVLVEGQRLVAFVETEPGAPAPASWRELLTRTLPAAMIPARVTALPGLPLTGAGKVDRRALTALAEAAPAAAAAPPATPLERRIATVWETVLEVAPVGRDDDFFALGGSSLRSIQLAARLRAEGIPVEARTLLLARTVAALAARIEEAAEAPPPAAADTITLGEQEFWAAWRLGRPQAGALVRRVLAVSGAVPPPPRWAAAWAALIARHPALRGGFDAESDGTVRPLRRDPADTAAPFPVEAVADPAAARARIEAHLAVPFDPARPPLARAGLVRIAAAEGTGGETLLWLGIHHAVADGESVRQLESDLLALVEGNALPPASDGPALARAEEARHRDGPAAAAARQEWRDRLAALA